MTSVLYIPKSTGTPKPLTLIKPPLRWVGGKAWLADLLVPEILDQDLYRYHEPFLGGGSILINVASKMLTAASDINGSLINFWQRLKGSPAQLHKALLVIVAQYGATKEGYLAVRARFNAVPKHTSMWDAAAFLYLNILAFNGIWRVNSRGEFNVPFGDRTLDAFPTLDALFEVSYCLQARHQVPGDGNESCWLVHRSFEDVIPKLDQGDGVYADPPYYGTYDGYVKEDFGPAQQGMLAEMLREAAGRGVRVWATNTDCPQIRAMYSWASVEPLHEPRRVAANGDRKKAACVLIRA